MKQSFSNADNAEFIAGIDESFVAYKIGSCKKCKVILADANGVQVSIGGKLDGLIRPEDICADGTYNSADYVKDMEFDAILINKKDEETNCVLLSKKRYDEIKEGDKKIEFIRNGEEFNLSMSKETKGGLISALGTYTVFVPASQIKESFVKDLRQFVGKTLRLTALEIDDDKRKIVASQRKLLETERREKESVFWTHVQPNVVVNGIVKRATPFGAFVNIDGFDCLAHIADLSWSHVKNVEDILKINESYDFLVLAVDKEKGRVSLGYKQLQPHPFTAATEKYAIGSIFKGKVARLMPFGAFVELEPGLDGLVHVSESAHEFVKDIKDVVKVGDVVDVMIMSIDPNSRKINLSIKACTEAPVREDNDNSSNSDQASAAPKSRKKPADRETTTSAEWSEDNTNNPFADLLKEIEK